MYPRQARKAAPRGYRSRRKRGNGQGTVIKRGKIFAAIVTTGRYTTPDGKSHPIRVSQGGFRTKSEAAEYLTVLLLPNNNIGNLMKLKESGDLIRRMLQSPHEGSCFTEDNILELLSELQTKYPQGTSFVNGYRDGIKSYDVLRATNQYKGAGSNLSTSGGELDIPSGA